MVMRKGLAGAGRKGEDYRPSGVRHKRPLPQVSPTAGFAVPILTSNRLPTGLPKLRARGEPTPRPALLPGHLPPQTPDPMSALRLLALALSAPLALWGTGSLGAPATPSDFATPIATIDGVPVTRGELADYLIALSGRGPLEDLVALRLLEQEARTLDPTGARVDAALDAAWDEDRALMLQRTAGDAAALEADLADIGFTPEQYEARFRTYKRAEVIEALLVLANRTVDEAALKRLFELQYGTGGVRVQVRHLMLNRAQLKAGLIKQGADPATLDNGTLDGLIAEKLAELHAEILAGADFEEVARRESFDLSVNQNGGLIPNYDYQHYGPAFAAAVRAAEVGELVGPLQSQAAVHLLRVESRTVTKLEDVRTALEAELLARPVEFVERTALRKRLLDARDVQYF